MRGFFLNKGIERKCIILIAFITVNFFINSFVFEEARDEFKFEEFSFDFFI